MIEREILKRTREMISEHAGGDADKWWYANRFVFARLQLDERKTKTSVKRKLLDASRPCHACGEPFESKRDIHLHRLDGSKAYSDANCVLMHAECHRRHHATQQEDISVDPGREPGDVPAAQRAHGRRVGDVDRRHIAQPHASQH